MRWRARRDPTPTATVARRAVLVPLEARITLDNESNLSPDSVVATRLLVVVRPDDTGGDDRAQEVTAGVPNWLRVVFCYAGSNHGLGADLPAEVEVDAQVDPASGAVVSVDVDAAARDLAAYRDVATRWWKETDAPLADLRGLKALPGDVVRGVKGFAGTWRQAVSDLRADAAGGGGAAPAHGEAETEQLRRSSATVRHRLQGNAKQRDKARASALEAGPMMVVNMRSGSMSASDLESWLAFQVGSGAVTEAEAAEWRAEAHGS